MTLLLWNNSAALTLFLGFCTKYIMNKVIKGC